MDYAQLQLIVARMHPDLLAFLTGACFARAHQFPNRSFLDVWKDVIEDAEIK